MFIGVFSPGSPVFDSLPGTDQNMRIAIADDEPEVVHHLKEIVQELGYEAVEYTDGNVLMQTLAGDSFDLIMLDWNMPGKDGLEILKWMQKTLPERPPVLMITNRSAKKDVTDALYAGASDYISKPEDRAVIEGRISAMLRRGAAGGAFDTEATYGIYHLNRIEQTVAVDGQTIALTAKEFELVDFFFRNTNRTISRHYLMQAIWRTTANLATRTLDMHISRVRSKLNLHPENGFRILTVFGYGYRLEAITKTS